MQNPILWLRASKAFVVLLSLLALALASCSGSASKPATPTPTPSTQTPPTEAPMPQEPTPNAASLPLETAYLGGGCFWCVEAVLERIDGVVDVESGYMGGNVDNPTYRQVCDGDTGHAEIVKVVFEPQKISFRQLLDWFFLAHDPTTKNRQGNDYGTQYRSAIFYVSDAQKKTADEAKAAANERLSNRVVTEITKASTYWPAEDYHQDYFELNPTQPYCNALIPPKLEKLGLKDKPKHK
jgi:peptide-methionine (S)-S-oxide reductase